MFLQGVANQRYSSASENCDKAIAWFLSSSTNLFSLTVTGKAKFNSVVALKKIGRWKSLTIHFSLYNRKN